MDCLKQTNAWSCLPTAASILLGCRPEEIYIFLGHDGSEIKTPYLTPPHCFQGFTPDDIIHYAYYMHERYGVCLDASYGKKFPMHENGILLGTNGSGHEHAVAYIAGKVYDPADGCIKNGPIFRTEGMIIFR